MSHASQLDSFRVSAIERLDVVDVLKDRGSIPRAFVDLVPLIVIMKNQRYDVVKVGDETILRDIIDQAVKTLVEFRKVMEVDVYPLEQVAMIGLEHL